ncbi:hypothetical protein D3C78_1921790 [compost metagenome]
MEESGGILSSQPTEVVSDMEVERVRARGIELDVIGTIMETVNGNRELSRQF